MCGTVTKGGGYNRNSDGTNILVNNTIMNEFGTTVMNASVRREGMLRAASKADHDALYHMVNQAYRVERWIKRDGGDRLDEQEGELEQLLESGRFLILEDESGPLASVYLEPRGERCYLGTLSVKPSRQGQGLARKMLEAAEAFASAHGCSAMELTVVSPRRDELVPLYAKFGYSEEGVHEYPPELQEKMVSPGHFIVMTKPLRTVKA